MTIRAYIENGPHIKLVANNHKGNVTYHHEAFGETVLSAEIDPNISVSDNLHLLEKIPVEFENVLRYWSLREQITIDKTSPHKRAVGKYFFGNSVAEVNDYVNSPSQNISITGKDIKECVRLSEMILAGTIPVSIPYSVPQVTNRVLRVREALHQLIESIAIAFDCFRLRRSQ